MNAHNRPNYTVVDVCCSNFVFDEILFQLTSGVVLVKLVRVSICQLFVSGCGLSIVAHKLTAPNNPETNLTFPCLLNEMNFFLVSITFFFLFFRLLFHDAQQIKILPMLPSESSLRVTKPVRDEQGLLTKHDSSAGSFPSIESIHTGKEMFDYSAL